MPSLLPRRKKGHSTKNNTSKSKGRKPHSSSDASQDSPDTLPRQSFSSSNNDSSAANDPASLSASIISPEIPSGSGSLDSINPLIDQGTSNNASNGAGSFSAAENLPQEQLIYHPPLDGSQALTSPTQDLASFDPPQTPPAATAMDSPKTKSSKLKKKPRIFSGSKKVPPKTSHSSLSAAAPAPEPVQPSTDASNLNAGTTSTSANETSNTAHKTSVSAFASSIGESIVNTFTFGSSSHDHKSSNDDPLQPPPPRLSIDPPRVSTEASPPSPQPPSQSSSRFPSVFSKRLNSTPSTIREEPTRKQSKWKLISKRRDSISDTSNQPSPRADPGTAPQLYLNSFSAKNISSISLNAHMRPPSLQYPRLSVDDIHSRTSSTRSRRSSLNVISSNSPQSIPRSTSARSLVDRHSLVSFDNDGRLNYPNDSNQDTASNNQTMGSTKRFDSFFFKSDFKNPFHRTHNTQTNSNGSLKFKPTDPDDPASAICPKKPALQDQTVPEITISLPTAHEAVAAQGSVDPLAAAKPDQNRALLAAAEEPTQPLDAAAPAIDSDKPAPNTSKTSHSIFSLAANFISDHTSGHSSNTSTASDGNISSNETPNAMDKDLVPELPQASNAGSTPATGLPLPHSQMSLPPMPSTQSSSLASTLKAPLSRFRRKTVSMLFSNEASTNDISLIPREIPPITPVTPFSDIVINSSNTTPHSDNASSPSPTKSAAADRLPQSRPSTPSLQHPNSTLTPPNGAVRSSSHSLHRTQSGQSPTRGSQRYSSSPNGSTFQLVSRPRSRTWSSLEQRSNSAHSGIFSNKYSDSNLSSLAVNRNSPSPTSSPALRGVSNASPSPRHSMQAPPTQAHAHTPSDPFSVPLPQIEPDESPAAYLSKIRTLGFGSNITGLLAKVDDDFHRQVLKLYLNGFHFQNDPLDMALRKFLISVKLPREAQQIDRVLEAFAFRYHECNPDIYNRPEDVYFFVFSLVLLQTDYFNPNNKFKMSKLDYLKIKSEPDHQSVSEEILGYFYDNITYTPFIHTDEDLLEPGQSVKMSWARRGTTFGRSSRELLDPYSLLLEGRLDTIRPRIALRPDDDPYSFLTVEDKEEMIKLRQDFENGPSLQFVSQRSRPDAFKSMTANSLEDPNVNGPAGVVGIKIIKAGYLYKCDAKKKNWRRWGVMLTASKLYVFKDISWFQSTIMASFEYAPEPASNAYNTASESKFLRRPKKQSTQTLDPNAAASEPGADGPQPVPSPPAVSNEKSSTFSGPSTQPTTDAQPVPVFRPLVDGFNPTSVTVTGEMAALFYSNEEVKRNHAFLLIGRGGSREWYAGVDEADAQDWMKKINFAASFSTFFVAGMLGINPIHASRRPIHRMRSLRRNSDTSLTATTTDGTPADDSDAITDSNDASDISNQFSSTLRVPVTTVSTSAEESKESVDSEEPDTADQSEAATKAAKAAEETEAKVAAAAEQAKLAAEQAEKETAATIEATKTRHLERKSAVERRLEDISRQLEAKEQQVQEHIRTARHVQILAPILPKTRESILQYAGTLAARLDWNFMERKKLLCYQNYFTVDLEVEIDLCKKLGALDIDSPKPLVVSPLLSSDAASSAISPIVSPKDVPISPVAHSQVSEPLPVTADAILNEPLKVAKRGTDKEENKSASSNSETSNETSEESESLQSSATEISEESKKCAIATPRASEDGAPQPSSNAEAPKSPARSIDELSTYTLKEGPVPKPFTEPELTSASTVTASFAIPASSGTSSSSATATATPQLSDASKRTEDTQESNIATLQDSIEPAALPSGEITLPIKPTSTQISNTAACDNMSLHTASTVASSVTTINRGGISVNTRNISASDNSVISPSASESGGLGRASTSSSLYSSSSNKQTPVKPKPKHKSHSSSSSISSSENTPAKSMRENFWSSLSSSSNAEKSPGSPSSKRSPRRSFSLSLRSNRRNSINNGSAAVPATGASPNSSAKRMLMTLRDGVSNVSSSSASPSSPPATESMSTRTLRKNAQQSQPPALTVDKQSPSTSDASASEPTSAPSEGSKAKAQQAAGSSVPDIPNTPVTLGTPENNSKSSLDIPPERGRGRYDAGSDRRRSLDGPGRSPSLMRKQGENITLLGKQFHVVQVNPEFGGPFNQHRRAVSQNFSAASLAFSASGVPAPGGTPASTSSPATPVTSNTPCASDPHMPLPTDSPALHHPLPVANLGSGLTSDPLALSGVATPDPVPVSSLAPPALGKTDQAPDQQELEK